MKKIIIALVFYYSLFITHYSLSRGGWFPLNSGTSIMLNKIQFVNSQTGWAGGFQSLPTQYILIKTTNGGLNWVNQVANFPYGNRILSFCYLDINTGYIAGGDGLFKTTNGGNNYSAFTPLTIACIDCYFTNTSTGWVSVATGNSEIYRTTNGGTNWISNFYSSHPSSRYTYIRFANSNTGWCVNDSIFKTTNGGINWVRQILPVIPFHSFLGIFSVSTDTAWVVGTSGIFLSTINGGTNWVSKLLSNSYAVTSAYFLNANTGYVCTTPRNVFKTTNNGLNWTAQMTDTAQSLNSIWFTSPDTGYVCGTAGKIYKTVNGGAIGIKQIENEIPEKFTLEQNYPNPFNPVTTIRYSIPSIVNRQSSMVILKIFDILGKQIATLVNEKQSPGIYELTFDGSGYPSGVYFYTLETQSNKDTKKMLMIK